MNLSMHNMGLRDPISCQISLTSSLPRAFTSELKKLFQVGGRDLSVLLVIGTLHSLDCDPSSKRCSFLTSSVSGEYAVLRTNYRYPTELCYSPRKLWVTFKKMSICPSFIVHATRYYLQMDAQYNLIV